MGETYPCFETMPLTFHFASLKAYRARLIVPLTLYFSEAFCKRGSGGGLGLSCLLSSCGLGGWELERRLDALWGWVDSTSCRF